MRYIRDVSVAVCSAAALYSSILQVAEAADAPTVSAKPPSISAVLAATPDFQVSGDLAAIYSHFDTNPTSFRAFDGGGNGFTFNQASLTLSDLPSSGPGGQATVIGGEDGNTLRRAETWPYNSASSGFDLYTAYFQYATPHASIALGKLPTLVGVESVNQANNNELSRSLLFWDMQPGSHVGIRITAPVTGTFSFIGGVNDGWNFTSSPSGVGQTVELGVSGQPDSRFSYTGTILSGGSPLYGTAGTGRLTLVDGVASYALSSAWSFTINGDILSKSTFNGPGSGAGRATGLAGYVNWTPNAKWVLSLRGERIVDSDGIVSGTVGTPNTLEEATIAVNYLLASNLKVSGEIRVDKSDAPVFSTTAGKATAQRSVELGAAYSF